ncbi:methyl-accepting chemotaxis protein [Phenylobacterium sp. RIFCSPHIGHO2_01_FULL_69_31]|uniref:HAMP domain-containing methyl-accepting chemotaxis protein n=1 Tax=Phenylobacterium sp. RIFCSPHIGHO2_01_FULL_69_31 TaxID=1801944 RepID=UPI0025E2F9C3|nr:methyl-accepting chemotaxis protein [Phenylobacterium sp. RIFCSPHIGHO2_01_FULL_69_31]
MMNFEMNIPKKLSLSFVLICVSAAVMMVVFLATILMIRATTESNNRSQSIHADALALETAILRQNSQLRGYLVTGDKSYLKSYYEGRDEYDEVSQKLKSTLTDPAMLKAVEASRVATVAWRKDWGDRLIQVVGSGGRDQAQQEVRDAGSKVLVSAAVLPLRDVRNAEAKHIAQNGSRQQMAIVTAMVALAIGGVALIAIAMTLSRMLSRTIARPITTLTEAMTQLAKGDNDIAVDADRADELGDMARAVLVFRDAALAKAEADRAKAEADRAKEEADRARIGAEAAQRRVVETLDTALAALASGDLTHVITTPFEPEYERLRQSFNSAVEGLEQSISGVAKSAQSVHSGAAEIYSASEDLSRRTEQQAASLEETTAATQQVTVMVSETARRAAEARTAIEVANGNAAEGGAIVTEAISAMDAIQTSSEEISQIINLIDSITFQTNLLALNAGVEAARAGDAGKGFAVVASEVRALAQRSADAARDIKALIHTSSEQVASGVGRVGHTGEMLTLIGAKIGDTNDLINEIAQNTETQAENLKQVSSAVTSMDRMTQQNAAMVNEATAAARSLATQADELATLVARFRLRSAAATADRPEDEPTAPVVRLRAAAGR